MSVNTAGICDRCGMYVGPEVVAHTCLQTFPAFTHPDTSVPASGSGSEPPANPRTGSNLPSDYPMARRMLMPEEVAAMTGLPLETWRDGRCPHCNVQASFLCPRCGEDFMLPGQLQTILDEQRAAEAKGETWPLVPGSPPVAPLQALREALGDTVQHNLLDAVEEQLAALQRERDEARKNLSACISPPDMHGVRMICLGYHEETDEYEWLSVMPVNRERESPGEGNG